MPIMTYRRPPAPVRHWSSRTIDRSIDLGVDVDLVKGQVYDIPDTLSGAERHEVLFAAFTAEYARVEALRDMADVGLVDIEVPTLTASAIPVVVGGLDETVEDITTEDDRDGYEPELLAVAA
ncbi:hypothetical protein C0Q58_30580 [Streptomyces albidoflavus]|uniref:hypothetical protein n=1 Tax=Streptomyces albidoflavus TaxID=1886 RepID=UPI00101E3F2D|nr:hypothetical protein [Streptomyces albidoflavus]RZD55251.1 hypothetical protein C0Q58_30580 [Streptomyces albidoflavus]